MYNRRGHDEDGQVRRIKKHTIEVDEIEETR